MTFLCSTDRYYLQAEDSGFPLQMATMTNIETVIATLKNSLPPLLSQLVFKIPGFSSKLYGSNY
jgi:hypothetical protein